MDRNLVKEVAPKGVLRAAIKLGNPVLAVPGEQAGSDPRGVSVDLARALAGRLGLALEPLVFDSPGKSIEAVARGDADIGFFPLEPARAAQLRFTSPYVLVEGAYAIGVPVGRSLAVVRQFVEDMKADGFVGRALKRHGITGAVVAPAMQA
jgi:polar amino acid transport system substrate-binding protein